MAFCDYAETKPKWAYFKLIKTSIDLFEQPCFSTRFQHQNRSREKVKYGAPFRSRHNHRRDGHFGSCGCRSGRATVDTSHAECIVPYATGIRTLKLEANPRRKSWIFLKHCFLRVFVSYATGISLNANSACDDRCGSATQH